MFDTKNESVRLWLKAMGWGMAGAFISALVFPAISYLIARICFPAALAKPDFVRQLGFNPLAFMAGGVTGLALVLRGGPPLARGVAGGLCLWIGSCTTIIPALFVVVTTWRHVAGLPNPAQNMGDPLAFVWAIMFPCLLLGVAPVRIGLQLYSFRPGASSSVVWQGLKAALWPNPANKLQSYVLSCPLDEEDFIAKVREEAEIAQNPVTRFLLIPLRKKKAVVATLKRNGLVFVGSKSKSGYNVRASIEENNGTSVIHLRSVLQPFFLVANVWFFAVLSLATVAATSGAISAAVTRHSYSELLQSLIVLSLFWYVVTSLFRGLRFGGKRQEEFIVQWVVSKFGCQILETAPAKFRPF